MSLRALVLAFASDDAGIVFAGIAAIITAFAALTAAWKSGGAKKAALGAQVEATAANKAVNNVGSDEPTLRELVVGIAEDLGELKQRLTTVEAVVQRTLD